MNIKITSKDGITLKTKDTYIREDISVAVDDSILGGDPTQEDGLIDGSITSYSNSRVTTVRNYAFYYNTILTHINLPKATSVGNATFQSCTALKSIDLPLVTSIGNTTFDTCSALTSVNLPQVTSIGQSTFNGCTGLTNINIPNVTSIGDSAFYDCSKLTSVNLPLVTSIGRYAFRNCYLLKAVVIRQETQVCTLSNTNAFVNCSHITSVKDGYIYVPDSLVDSYKSATNWSTYADQIRALEDYTVDGTTTGELDESKI